MPWPLSSNFHPLKLTVMIHIDISPENHVIVKGDIAPLKYELHSLGGRFCGCEGDYRYTFLGSQLPEVAALIANTYTYRRLAKRAGKRTKSMYEIWAQCDRIEKYLISKKRFSSVSKVGRIAVNYGMDSHDFIKMCVIPKIEELGLWKDGKEYMFFIFSTPIPKYIYTKGRVPIA